MREHVHVQSHRSNDNMVRWRDKLLLIIFVIIILYVLLNDRPDRIEGADGRKGSHTILLCTDWWADHGGGNENVPTADWHLVVSALGRHCGGRGDI